MKKLFLMVMILSFVSSVAMAQNKSYYVPKRGSAERKMIMNAARVPIVKALKRRVIFVVDTLRSNGEWAFMTAVPHEPNGSKLKWHKTPYAEDWKGDFMSDLMVLLLHKEGKHWRAVTHCIGPTDVCWYDWGKKYHVPKALLMSK